MPRIAVIESVPVRIPFGFGGGKSDEAAFTWKTLDTVLVRVATDDGLVGWGDAFAYGCQAAVAAAVEHMVKPLALGRDAADIGGMSRRLQRDLHIFGRYGITMFAISGLDIALWDLAGKRAGQPLHRLLGGGGVADLAAYASLYKYADPEQVARRAAQAVSEGYDQIKLHETGVSEVAAARAAIGPSAPLMVDTNCPWTPDEALRMARALAPCDLHWLEEPVFPPEDFAALRRLGDMTGIPIAAGENACTAFQFQAMIEARAVSFAQPSVSKVGGVTEFLKIAALCETQGVTLAPHSPYFGPGFLATLHLAAARSVPTVVEWFHLDREACFYGDRIAPSRGRIPVPQAPGLGFDPDPAVIERYRVKAF